MKLNSLPYLSSVGKFDINKVSAIPTGNISMNLSIIKILGKTKLFSFFFASRPQSFFSLAFFPLLVSTAVQDEGQARAAEQL